MLDNLVVVSDIDDTIKWSHILGPEVLVDGLDYHLAFIGMPELYTALSSAGATIVYVTGGPDLLIGKLQANFIPQKVVSANHFPNGEIHLHQLGESTEDFKVQAITAVMKRYSDRNFILIGDNGERDIVTYMRVREDPEIGGRVKQVFIHKIYNGGSSLEPLANQYPFITSADLAAMLYGYNYLAEEDLMVVLQMVNAGMNGSDHDHNLTLPFAAQLVPDQVDAVYGPLSTTLASPAQVLLQGIYKLIMAQARQGPRFF